MIDQKQLEELMNVKRMYEEEQARKAAKKAAKMSSESNTHSLFESAPFLSTPMLNKKPKNFKEDLVKNALNALQHVEDEESDYKSESEGEKSLFQMPVFKSKICSTQEPKQNNFFPPLASNIQNSVYEDFLTHQRKNVVIPGGIQSPIPFDSYCQQEKESARSQDKMIGEDLMKIIDSDINSTC